MKILISGGHLTPALALMDYVGKHAAQTQIVLVGRAFNRDIDLQPSQEKREASKRHVKFIELKAAKLGSLHPVKIIPQIFVLIASLIKSLSIIADQRPDVFVSFGGYLALPLAVAAWILRVPIVTHEQTRAVGISNQLIAHLANRIAISFPSSTPYFPKHKTVLTGNLVRSELLNPHPVKPEWLKTDNNLPLLYITGGSQGSEVINMTIKNILPQLTKDWQIIHQCGAQSNQRSYLTELEQAKNQLPISKRSRYTVKEWVTTEELSWIYKHARLVVSRAGANTTYELIYFSIPAVLIPLPFAHHHEQEKNAQNLVETGGALLIHQKQLSGEVLLDAIAYINRRYKACRQKLAQLTVIRDADQQLWELIQAVAVKK